MAETDLPERLRTQAAAVDRALFDLEAIVSRAADAAARVRAAPDDLVTVMGGGGLLHGFYSTLEGLMRDVAVNLNGQTPAGEAWHARILDQMCHDVPGVRPRLFPPGLRDRLDDYLGFRHVYRNLYVFNLKPRRIAELLDALPEVWNELGTALATFAAALREMASALRG